MTDTVCRNPTFLAIRHAVPSWSLSMSPISRNAPRASRQHPQKQDRPGGRGDTIAFPVAALLEWLAAPVTQACHYVAYPHTTADSTSADQPLRSPLLAQLCRRRLLPGSAAIGG